MSCRKAWAKNWDQVRYSSKPAEIGRDHAQPAHSLHHLIVVLGDQINHGSNVLEGVDTTQDGVWMADVAEDSAHVRSTRQRTILFLVNMRHFAAVLSEVGLPRHCRRFDDTASQH
jgi:deoxyribodipyrimidine photolyase-related protein